MPAGTIVTFYSYKGGTGRSMALANTAWILASNGARVLAVDWDLEAPGLHRYFRPFLGDKQLTRIESQGVIDLMADFVARLATPAPPDKPRDASWYREHADLSKWSKRLLWPSGADAITGRGGTIDFVPAGRQDAQYAKKVNSFDWSSFYERCNGGAFIDEMRRSMAQHDWVLIDSRTGVSDTSGICTVQLPDILVVCFTLNYQSIEGAAAVAASSLAIRKSGLRVLPLPTRLDGNEEKLLTGMMQYAERTFSPLMPPDIDRTAYWREMGVPYFSRYAYIEKLAPFENQVNVSTSTLPSMERLTSYLTEGRITTLQPLPESDRKDALEEFEALPGSDLNPVAMSAPAAATGLSRFDRFRYLFRANPYLPLAGAALLALLAVAWTIWSISSRPPPSAVRLTAVEALATASSEAAKAGQLERAALLVAEAAARLDSSTVVSPEGTVAPVYQAFMALVPLRFELPDVPLPAGRVAFSGDGNWMAAAQAAGPARLFQFPPRTLSGGRSIGYSAMAFSPDSRFVAVGRRGGGFGVIDVETGRLVRNVEANDPDSVWTTAIAFSQDNQAVAGGSDSGELAVAFETGSREGDRVKMKGAILALAFADPGLLAGSSADGTVLVYARSKPGEIARLGPHSGPVRSIAFLPDSTVAKRPDGTQTASPVAFRIAAASGDAAISFWSWASGRAVRTLVPAGKNANALAISADGQLMVTAGEPAQVWRRSEARGGTAPPFTAAASLKTGMVESLALSPDGKVLVTGADGTLTVWDTSNGNELQRQELGSAITSVALSPDGRYAVVAAGPLRFLPIRTPNQPLTFSALQIQRLACSQTTQNALPAADWEKFFGPEPIRFTCSRGSDTEPPAPRRPSLP
jgi:hypothetical protein